MLDAAATVFAEQGLEASVDAVIEAAGVGTGTFYRRFPNKGALLDELVDEMLGRVIALAEKALAQHGDDGTALERFLLTAGEFSAEKAGLARSLWSQRLARISPEHQQAFESCLADLLASARKAGQVDRRVTVSDVRDAIRAVTGIVNTAPAGDWRRHMRIWLAGVRPSGS